MGVCVRHGNFFLFFSGKGKSFTKLVTSSTCNFSTCNFLDFGSRTVRRAFLGPPTVRWAFWNQPKVTSKLASAGGALMSAEGGTVLILAEQLMSVPIGCLRVTTRGWRVESLETPSRELVYKWVVCSVFVSVLDGYCSCSCSSICSFISLLDNLMKCSFRNRLTVSSHVIHSGIASNYCNVGFVLGSGV